MVSQDSSARNALQTFLAGRGDALIDYEDEAISDREEGLADRIRDPARHDPDPEPDRGGGSKGTAQAKNFVNYLLSPAGQAIWVEEGLPPGDLAACRARTASRRPRGCSRSKRSAAGAR